MNTSTWPRDSHMLYDYETSSVSRKTLKILHSTIITRLGNDVLQSDEQENEALVSVLIDHNDCILSSTKNYPVWLIIRSPRNSVSQKSYTLRQGTIIKLGRLQFRVKAIKREGDHLDEAFTEAAEEKGLMCRICLCENSEKANPLISICKCSGTMKYIHIGCLQKWMNSRVTENTFARHLKSIDCELCKKKLPFTIKVNSVSYDLVKCQRPEMPFLILEGIQAEQREPGVYLISFKNKSSVMLGRGHDSDVRIPDISVSRCHAKISFVDNEFMIQDNNSKFGTLIMLEGPQVLEKRLSVQCGRTVMEFSRNLNRAEEKFEWEE